MVPVAVVGVSQGNATGRDHGSARLLSYGAGGVDVRTADHTPTEDRPASPVARDRHVRGKWIGMGCRSFARTRCTRGGVRSASRWYLPNAAAVADEVKGRTQHPQPQRRGLVSFVSLICLLLTVYIKLKRVLHFTFNVMLSALHLFIIFNIFYNIYFL